ncbi:MAG TPA: glycosyl hydrolase [Actinomycetota bacterium]|nr:glycosyl hydrolase [Actinomycetota bacterium]
MTAPRPLDLDVYKSPNRDYGILPFWFLNGELDPDEMLYQLGELRAKGMQGVIFHGRYGLEMPYVGDTYLERIRFGVEEANRLGLASWIYDEMNWPSGTADKRVLKERPDLAQRYLECVSFLVRGPWFMCLTGEDSRYMDFERSTPVAIFAVGEDGAIVDLTSNLSFDKVVPWEVPPGLWSLHYIVEKRADYYIDALDPEATATFLRLGYDPYVRALSNGSAGAGKSNGRALEGFYSDEPAMHYFLTAVDNAIVPWTKNMFRRFEERNGYNLRPRLLDLFFDIQPDAARTRYDFYNTTTAFYSDAYYRQIHEWCQKHHLTFTAHLLFEEWLRQMVRVEGNAFRHYEHMDVVAVDHLYPIIGTRENPAEHVAMKLASSAAHHFGSERVICESFGGIFMDATMQRMKWIADWEYVLGVTVINPHGFHYTFEGARKRDWPPSMFYQYPWWRYYEEFSNYNSRVSEMLTGGVHVAKIAVVWPINSIFATYKPQERTPENTATESGLNLLTDLLLRLHHDFDYIDEEVLADAEVENGQLCVGDEAYELVLLPPMDFIREPTIDKLEDFVAEGGRALSVLTAPTRAFDATGSIDVTERAGTLFGRGDGDSSGTARERQGGRAAFIPGSLEVLSTGPGEVRDRFAATLDDAVKSLIEPDLTVSNPEVFVLHRRKDDGDIYFLVNTTFDRQDVTVTLPHADRAVLWDPTTGERGRESAARPTDAGTTVDLALEPVGSMFVVTGAAALPAASSDGVTSVSRRSVAATETVLAGPWTFEAEDDNALVIKSWKAARETSPDHDVYLRSDGGDEGWQPVIGGAWSYQLPAEPEGEWPMAVWYRAGFDVLDVPSRFVLLIDGFAGTDREVWLNGRRAPDATTRSRLDSQMKELDLSALVQAGHNVLAIRVILPGTTSGVLDHIKLMGSFAVTGDDESGYTIVAPDDAIEPRSWTEQGYPFLSGCGVYRTSFDLPSDGSEPRVLLDIPMQDDVVEVMVNGERAGVRLWDPYIVDISRYVHPGRNELALRIANTPANLLNGVPRPSGLAGAPRLRVAEAARDSAAARAGGVA